MSESEIIVKVRKLIEQERGERAVGNSAAAALFAEKVQELCIKYKLERADVEGVQVNQDPIADFTIFPDRHGYKQQWRRVKWQEDLAAVVAHAHFCQILLIPGSNVLSFAGRRSDREIAGYMFVYLVRKCEELLKVARKSARRRAGFATSFRIAFTEAIALRYRQKRREVEERLQREAGRDTGGEPCASLIVLRDAHKAVADWVNENVKKTAKDINGDVSHNLDGYMAGRKHGQNVSLDANAIETNTRKSLTAKGN